jgi:hypothetical protein
VTQWLRDDPGRRTRRTTFRQESLHLPQKANLRLNPEEGATHPGNEDQMRSASVLLSWRASSAKD